MEYSWLFPEADIELYDIVVSIAETAENRRVTRLLFSALLRVLRGSAIKTTK